MTTTLHERSTDGAVATMRAAVVHDFIEPLVVEDVPKPTPGAGQVVVKVEASGLCHTDIHAARGDWPITPTPPFIPGHEGVGIVERVGPGNSHGLELATLSVAEGVCSEDWVADGRMPLLVAYDRACSRSLREPQAIGIEVNEAARSTCVVVDPKQAYCRHRFKDGSRVDDLRSPSRFDIVAAAKMAEVVYPW